MAVFFTDFSEYPAGSAPADWSKLWNAVGTWEVRDDDASAQGGKYLKDHTTTAGYYGLIWDAVGQLAHGQDVEVLIRMREDGAPNSWHEAPYVREYGSRTNSQGLSPGRYTDTPSFGGYATIVSPVAAGGWIWVRLQVVGQIFRIRQWADGNAEPAAWTWEGDRSSDTGAAGGVGFAAAFGNGPRSFDVFGVSTDPVNEPAPSTQPPSTYRDVILADGPLAYWRLEDNYEDSSGNGYGLVVFTGAPAFVGGLIAEGGKAVSIDGNDGLRTSITSSVYGTSERTFEAWVTVANSVDYDPFINQGPNSPSGARFTMRKNDSSLGAGQPGALRVDVAGGYIVGSTRIDDGLVHHVVAVLPPSATPNVTDILLYVDGVLETISSSGAQAINTSQAYFEIAFEQWAPRYMTGTIDEVAVYARALSAAEVQEHYNAGLVAGNAPPAKPTASVPATTDTTADLASSAFSDPDGDLHAASRWQVDEQAGDWSTPLVDSGEDVTNLTAYTATGLPSDTALQARVQHKDDQGNWSEWSDAVLFSTDAPAAGPAQPTIAVGTVTDTTAALSGSAFSDPNADTHSASQWQVDEAAGDWTTPVVDSGQDATNLTSYTATGLPQTTDLMARVRYMDSTGLWSDWSTPVAFSTQETEVSPGQPTITATATGKDTADLAGSAFSDANVGDTHAASRWQIQLVGGDWSAPAVDTGTDAVNLTAYSASGLATGTSYEARVQYQDSTGLWSSWSTVDTFTTTGNLAPVADFTAVEDGLSVDVDAAASSDPDGTIASYQWDWGDGSPLGSGVTARHTYATGGDYTITLTVTDDEGATSSISTLVFPNAPPVAAFTQSVSLLTVALDASASSDPEGAIASYEWDLGDGTLAMSAQIEHTYAMEGTYTITLTVTDAQGATDTETLEVTVARFLASEVPADAAWEDCSDATEGLGFPSTVDFEDYALVNSANPTPWKVAYDSNGSYWLSSDPTYTGTGIGQHGEDGGKVLRIRGNGQGTRGLAFLDQDAVVDAEVWGKVAVQIGNDNVVFGVFVRGAEAVGGVHALAACVDESGQLGVYEWRSDRGTASPQLAPGSPTVPASLAIGQWVGIRMRVEGQRVRARTWDFSDPEPDTWGIDFVLPDGYLDHAGRVGFAAYGGFSQPADLDTFGFSGSIIFSACEAPPDTAWEEGC